MSIYDPNTWPCPIEPIEPESRIKLLMAMFESMAADPGPVAPEDYMDTAEKSVECFEVITSAIKHGFLKEYDDLINVNGYVFRMFCPAEALDD